MPISRYMAPRWSGAPGPSPVTVAGRACRGRGGSGRRGGACRVRRPASWRHGNAPRPLPRRAGRERGDLAEQAEGPALVPALLMLSREVKGTQSSLPRFDGTMRMVVSLSEVRCEARVPPDHSSGCGTCERLREQRYGVADPVRPNAPADVPVHRATLLVTIEEWRQLARRPRSAGEATAIFAEVPPRCGLSDGAVVCLRVRFELDPETCRASCRRRAERAAPTEGRRQRLPA